MEIFFNSSYPFLIFLASLAIAGILSYLLYWKFQQDSPLSITQVRLLAGLRFLSVFLIAVLLLKLAVQHIKHQTQQPELIIGVDNSASLADFDQEVNQTVASLQDELKSFTPKVLYFEEPSQNTDSISFNGKRSDYSGFIEKVTNKYGTADIGALVLLGDGIFNAGIDPVYASEKLNFPIYTIGLGDTLAHTDAAIQNVSVNSTAFLDTNFPVEIDLNFTQAAGEIVTLVIKDGNKTLYSRAIRILSENYFFTESVLLKPEDTGIAHYTIQIDEIGGEQNLANNNYEFSVNVISDKQKILLLAHGAHPDLGAISSALAPITKYETELITGYPTGGLDFSEYDLVIVHQLPDNDPRSINLLEQLTKSRRPSLFILGKNSVVSRFNNLQTGIEIRTNNSFEQTTPTINTQFSHFKLDFESLKALQGFPPLLSPFGNVQADSWVEPLANQTIQNVETSRPLIAFGKKEGRKLGFILGEGIWRWRIHSYLNDRSHHLFDDLIQKTVNYLILKLNEDNFNLYWEDEYLEDQPVTIQAELFNESFELVNESDVEIDLNDQNGKNYHAMFDKSGDKYLLNLGILPPGEYAFKAQTQLGTSEYTEEGHFVVSKIQQELTNTQADFQVLNQIATKTGGSFILPNEVESLIEKLNATNQLSTRKLEQQVYQELLSMKWVFFIILLLLALEWFLRKYWGIY